RWTDSGEGSGEVVVFVAPTKSSGLDAQRRGLTDLVELVRRRTATGSGPGTLVVVTTHAQAATAERRPDPGAALCWGLVRVLRREHPELRTRLIDLHPEPDHQVVTDCVAELLSDSDDDQVVLDSGERYAGRLRQGDHGEAVLPPLRAATQPFELRMTPGQF